MLLLQTFEFYKSNEYNDDYLWYHQNVNFYTRLTSVAIFANRSSCSEINLIQYTYLNTMVSNITEVSLLPNLQIILFKQKKKKPFRFTFVHRTLYVLTETFVGKYLVMGDKKKKCIVYRTIIFV